MLANHPNTFIIGAPKAGTTSMSAMLNQHPDVYFSPIKEPSYYSRDIISLEDPRFQRFDDYLQLFSKVCSRKHKIIAEGSTQIMYSIQGIKEILSRVSNPKFIVMLRNPLDAAVSFYMHLLKSKYPDPEGCFEEAWNSIEARKRTTGGPYGKNEIYYRYDEAFLYGKYLTKVISLVNRENVHVILYDDFLKDPLLSYKKLLNFLGINDGFQVKVLKSNKAGIRRSGAFVSILSRFCSLSYNIRHKVGLTNLGVFETLTIRRGKNIESYRAISENCRSRMKQHFFPDIEKLERLINMDLSGWK